jgi:UDP-N-acetylmuramyl pentapeptide synthase
VQLTPAMQARLTTLEDLEPEPRVIGMDEAVGGPLVELGDGSVATVTERGNLLQPSNDALVSCARRRAILQG